MNNFKQITQATCDEELTVYSLAYCYSIVIKKIDDYLKSYGLSTAKFNALMIIKHQGGQDGIKQVDISKKLIVSASNMTKLLDRLKKDELIERIPQENDRRVNLIKITSKGSELLDSAWGGYIDIVKETTSILDKDSNKKLSELLVQWFYGLTKE